MTRAVAIFLCVVAFWPPEAVAQLESSESNTVSAMVPGLPFDEADQRRLNRQISDAAPEQIFAVDLLFEEPVAVEKVRAAAMQLRIPRILAYVDYGPAFEDRPRQSLILGLGEMYASESARRHTECRALISAGYSPDDDLRETPIEAWNVGRIHVYATAHAIRELQAGGSLPAAVVVDGSAAEPDHVRKLAAYTRDEVSRKIELAGNADAPDRCHDVVAPLDAPILAADYDPTLNSLPPLPDEDFREYAFRVLATLPPDSAVTIQLKLGFPATVDVLASLVWQFGIDGMSAELVPERSDQRRIATPELSIHGESLGDQVKRARCQMRLGIGLHTRSEWYADWISVSMPLDKAWTFLSYPRLSQARIVGRFPVSDLERLVSYYERRSEKVFEMPESFRIPPGCGDYYTH